jgi:exonuclease III
VRLATWNVNSIRARRDCVVNWLVPAAAARIDFILGSPALAQRITHAEIVPVDAKASAQRPRTRQGRAILSG